MASLNCFRMWVLFKVMLSFGIKHMLWDTTISGVYHSFQPNSSKKFRKLRKLGKRLFNYNLSSKPKKNTFTGLKTTQNCLFSSHLVSRQSWAKVLGHFCISGVFSNSHKSNPSPHSTNNVGCNISKTCASGFIRGSKHRGTDESTRPQAECFYCIVSFPNKTKKYTVIHFFTIVLPKWKNNNLKHCVNMHDYLFWCTVL